MAVDIEAVTVAGVGLDNSAEAGDALGVAFSLSVVGLLGGGMNPPDTRDVGVIGSDGILGLVA
jgi:hypothetical protein